MKLFSLLFCIYLVVLSGLPCGDTLECNEVNAVVNYTAGDHEEHNHTTEACTPFCNCACCATSVFFTPAVTLAISPVTLATIEIPYDVPFRSYDERFIWQPPKLG